MIRARLSSAAERDVLEAQEWYARQAPDLDLAFRDDLDHVLIQVRTHPASFPIVHENIRRASLRRFPFSVFYVLRPTHAWILGVVHQARHPRHWKGR